MWESVRQGPVLLTNAGIVTVGTYSAMFLIAFLPLLVANRTTRLPALIAAIGLHLSIGALMGLWGFALTMIACDLALAGDEHLTRTGHRFRSMFAGTTVTPVGPVSPGSNASEKVVVPAARPDMTETVASFGPAGGSGGIAPSGPFDLPDSATAVGPKAQLPDTTTTSVADVQQSDSRSTAR